MDAFSYLSVLLSIIIGLAITQSLQGLGRIIQHRRRVVMFWPSIGWAIFFVLVGVQMWWTLFGLRDRTAWSFFPFLAVVLQTVMLYLITAVVLPEIGPGEQVDLRVHYFREVPWLYGFIIALILVSLLRDYVLLGTLPNGENMSFLIAFIAIAIGAMLYRRVWFHQLIFVVSSVLFVAYVLLLFVRLPS